MALSAHNYSIHVLLVDHESKRLYDIGNMIRMCKDTVIAVESVADAITKLVEHNERFDLVLANINTPNSNSHFIGFKLIRKAIDMAIPIILMSSDNNNDRLMAASAIEMGVTLYLQKPVTIEVISCLWQYVWKEKVVKDSEKTDIGGCVGIVDMKESGNDDKGKSVKRGREEGRMEWTPELHEDFVAAIEQLGGKDSVGCMPREILKLMNHSTLTRQQVASHLQKYRKGKCVLPVVRKSTCLSILPVDTKSTPLSILQAPSHTEDSSGQPPKHRELTPPTFCSVVYTSEMTAPHLKIKPVDYSSSNPPLQLEEAVKEEEESTLLQNIQPGDSNPSNPPLQSVESEEVVKEAEESPFLTSPGMTEPPPSIQPFDMDTSRIDEYDLSGEFDLSSGLEFDLGSGLEFDLGSGLEFDLGSGLGEFDLSSGLGFHNELREEMVF